MIGVPDQSNAKCYVQSPALVRKRTVPFASFEIFIGYVPIQGFGTFITTSDYSGMPYNFEHSTQLFPTWDQNDIWPNVYQTLTETWTQSDGNIMVIVRTWVQNVDMQQTVTITGSGISAGSTSVVSVTATTINCTYAGSGVTGTYTAVLSNQLTPTWSTLAGQADTARATLSSADFDGAMVVSPNCYVVFAGVASSGVSKIPIFSNNILPSAYGMIVRLPQQGGSDPASWDWGDMTVYGNQRGMNLSMDEVPFLAYPSDVPFVKNVGGVVAISSQWVLTGGPPNYIGGGGYPYANYNNHLTIYQQTSNVSGPGSITVTTAAGFGTVIPGTYNFTSADTTTCLGAGNYGSLGFRNVGI